MRLAIDIARTLPACADFTDEQIVRVLSADFGAVGWHRPSTGERALLNFALDAQILLERCDADTIDAALEVLDRARAGMVR